MTADPSDRPRIGQQVHAAGRSSTALSKSGRQHVEAWRKVQLRRRLLRWAGPGAAYVPFIGDGDLAAECYRDRAVYGVDLDERRIETARERLPDATLLVENADRWPFADDLEVEFAVADFDAWLDPYESFRSFWRHAPLADRVVLIFTDDLRDALKGYRREAKTWTRPSGQRVSFVARDRAVQRAYFCWYSEQVWPYLVRATEGWRVLDRFRYLRGGDRRSQGSMLYHGVALARDE